MNTIESAVQGWNTYDLVPHQDKPYGDISMRLTRYNVALAYYHNSVYDSIERFSTVLKQEERLYRHIRGIVNPVRQENNLLVAYTYRGSIDTQTLKKGSLPLRFDNTQLETPLKQVIKWSNLDQALGTYVRDAALMGDAAWWVVDDPYRQRVRLELVDPARIRYVERDEVGNVKACIIEYMAEEQPNVTDIRPTSTGTYNNYQKKQTYIYTLKVTREKFQTFKDGEPFAFHRDSNGTPVSEWPNIYGFVPLKLAYYQEGKDGWGQNSFFGTPRRQIDELNDQASIINDSIRNVVVPLLQAKGLTPGSKITTNSDDKDAIRILYIPNENGELAPVTIPLDIAGATANRAVLMSELEKNMPVLALQRIRDIGGNLSGVAIQNMFSDATSCIENLRKNLNPPLLAALQMAVTIGGIQRYEGFAGFNERSYDAGAMELSIAETPVIEDRLTVGEKVDKLIQIADLPIGTKRQTLLELGYDEATVNTIIDDDEAQQEERARNAVRGLADSVFGNNQDMQDEDMSDDANTDDTTDPQAQTRQEDNPRSAAAA